MNLLCFTPFRWRFEICLVQCVFRGFQIVLDDLSEDFPKCTTVALLNHSGFNNFIHQCARLAWRMILVTPPLAISTDTGIELDKNFVVQQWPNKCCGTKPISNSNEKPDSGFSKHSCQRFAKHHFPPKQHQSNEQLHISFLSGRGYDQRSQNIGSGDILSPRNGHPIDHFVWPTLLSRRHGDVLHKGRVILKLDRWNTNWNKYQPKASVIYML